MAELYYADSAATVHHGDALTVLAGLPGASVDAVITDPPYEIGIAGRGWDRTGVAYSTDLWAQCLRVIKPGGHLLSFGAPRTYHRMACAAEDAGWRIVDQLDWIYTNGKPKGVDLARAIDRRRDDREQVLQVTAWLAAARDAAGWTNRQIDGLFGFSGMGGHWTTQGKAPVVPSDEQWARLREEIGFDDTEVLPLVTELNARKHTIGAAYPQREIISERRSPPRTTGLYAGGYSGPRIKSRAASDEARRWEGWNTALRPAHDPILLARKSTGFDSLTAGVLRHGAGGLNVATCPASGGGWPTNILLGHDCPPGTCLSGCPVDEVGARAQSFPVFRLESKTPVSERIEVDGVRHDTPKPLALMRWLVRLITPPGGLVLDPLAGSCTTLLAAALEGARGIGIEQQEPYCAIGAHRLRQPRQIGLFGGAA